MARRSRRRSTPRKRPLGPTPRPLTPTNGASGEAPEESLAAAAPEGQAPPAGQAPSPSRSLLPRRAQPPAPEPEPPSEEAEPARPEAAVATAIPAAATTSFLPRKGRVPTRAERLRQQTALLEPLDDSSAIPTDRTPYLWHDLRRVIFVSAVMIVLVIVGAFVLH